MSHVVTENCIKCKYMACASLCPVGAFHDAGEMLVINPDECVDCAICVHTCSADAIVEEGDLAENMKEFSDVNEKFSKLFPAVCVSGEPEDDADKWNGVPNKRRFIKL